MVTASAGLCHRLTPGAAGGAAGALLTALTGACKLAAAPGGAYKGRRGSLRFGRRRSKDIVGGDCPFRPFSPVGCQAAAGGLAVCRRAGCPARGGALAAHR